MVSKTHIRPERDTHLESLAKDTDMMIMKERAVGGRRLNGGQL